MAAEKPPVARVTQMPAGRGAQRAVVLPTLPMAPAVGGSARSHSEREEVGKALRDRVQRAALGTWKTPADRRNPIEILRAPDTERLQELVPIRYGRMLQSPFTFYRGAAAVMAADLAGTPAIGLRVQACGDCHLMNFGGFATPERNVIFGINDFDETLPAPFEWDVKRLSASFVLAARSIGLSDAKGADAATTCARAYRRSLRDFAEMHPSKVWYARLTAEEFLDRVPKRIRNSVEARMRKALARTGSEMDFPKLTTSSGASLPSVTPRP
jgi:hypothetical protein